MSEKVSKDGFRSQWGFILSAVGSCVGMANIWRFPMLISKYGGMTFLIPYCIFVFIISQSGMMEEFSLGRWSGFGPVGSFGKAMEDGGKSRHAGELIGGVPVFASLCLGIGYSVIMGWVFYYTKMSLTGELVAMGSDMSIIGPTFGAVAPEAQTLPEAIRMTLETGGANNFWIITAIVVSFLIMIMGISGGIEKACKIMIPTLYVLFIGLAIFMVTVHGTQAGYEYIFTLSPEKLLNPEVWVFAFGQCFFSLSVAGSGSVIYGSYLAKDVNIRKSAVLCAILDSSAAFLATLIIIPAYSLTGNPLESGGPGLMFVSLISIFNSMGSLARAVGIFFFVSVLFAGISSIINLFETPVAFLQEKMHLSRFAASAAIHIPAIIVAILIQPWTAQWMDMVSIYLCPLGAFTAGFMYFWIMKKETALAAVQEGMDKPIMSWYHSFGKYIFVPLTLLCFVLGIRYGGIG